MNWFLAQSFRAKLQLGYYTVVAFYTIIILILMLTADVSIIFALSSSLILMVFSFPYVRFLEKALTEPIDNVTRVAMNIAKGDFTQTVDASSKDALGDMGRSFNAMIVKLKELLNETASISKHVADSSRDIYHKNEGINTMIVEATGSVTSLAEGANEISSGVFKSFSVVKEIETKITDYVDSTHEMNNRCGQTLDLVKKGMRAVESQSESVSHIVLATSNVSGTIDDLVKEAAGISSITRTISEIAEQTNLLSLNASIEAARAGEHGRGFSVVAQEVRKLAEESSKSAKSVFHMVHNIENSIKMAQKNIQINEEIARRQTESIEATEKIFGEMVESIQFITQRMSEFTGESQKMLNAAQFITGTMENISAITQQSAAGTEQVSTSMVQQTRSVKAVVIQSEQMLRMVTQLQRTIQIFKL
ncbi:Methyl-accepting chemotaxis protein 4 [Paenibacillus allorhizoplanae]|jgi:methyl-accepting chemotaxis protein|uniref:Methyl-accepting chemotaxis protein 4 n=1 Tax=Paenibacillus allorhizoplanae TaxID=2905648 RepID=A0ABM9BXG1_9BACL|nr:MULTISPECIES: methyl-accepting chemotaxis protein [Paenibacillus]KRE69201.1 chemotaxis protein [Paenibacillus sp. Soil750]CAH1197016.1 Methyl-accepting chemotaxis protein 4 [Paenibacillus allorhizoplanae]